MILKIEFKSYDKIRLPKSYNHLTQAFFYSLLDRALRRELHDEGFEYKGRKFKLFTYSKIIGKQLSKTDKEVEFEPQIIIYFASILQETLTSITKNMLRQKEFDLGKNKMHISYISAFNPEVRTHMVLKCLSPITAYRTIDNKKQFYTPWQEEFYALIKQNLLEKYELIYGKSYNGVLEVVPHLIKPSYKKKVLYNNLPILAWEGYYKVEADEDMINVVLNTGLGSYNSAGFGMVVDKDIKVDKR